MAGPITDAELARQIGLKGSSEISGYKKREVAPPAPNVLVIAKICGVDPGWLAFGPDSDASEPPIFAGWLAEQAKPAAPAAPAAINWDRAPLIPAESLQAMPRRPRRQVMKKRKRG